MIIIEYAMQDENLMDTIICIKVETKLWLETRVPRTLIYIHQQDQITGMASSNLNIYDKRKHGLIFKRRMKSSCTQQFVSMWGSNRDSRRASIIDQFVTTNMIKSRTWDNLIWENKWWNLTHNNLYQCGDQITTQRQECLIR
jgi:hypothetical protein